MHIAVPISSCRECAEIPIIPNERGEFKGNLSRIKQNWNACVYPRLGREMMVHCNRRFRTARTAICAKGVGERGHDDQACGLDSLDEPLLTWLTSMNGRQHIRLSLCHAK